MKKENFDISKYDNSSTYIPYIQIYNNKIVKKDSLLPFILNGKQNQVLHGDILITISSENKDELGFSSIYLDDFCCYLNSFCFGIRLKNEFRNSIYQEYINIYFSSYNFRKKMFNISQGSTRYNLPKTDFLKFSILIPSINEQIKISKFFSLLDKHIELWERKLQLCLLKKKYYLNKLYIDNDLFPHLRFKEFNNGESKYKCDNLFNLCSFVKSGGTPASTNKDYYSGNIPFCSISDFDKNYLKCTKKYISDQAILDSSSFIFPKNNILLSIYASIGEVAINLIDVALPQSILGIIVSKIDLYYLFHLLQTNKTKRFFVNYSEQGTQPNLSKKTLKFLKV